MCRAYEEQKKIVVYQIMVARVTLTASKEKKKGKAWSDRERTNVIYNGDINSTYQLSKLVYSLVQIDENFRICAAEPLPGSQ